MKKLLFNIEAPGTELGECVSQRIVHSWCPELEENVMDLLKVIVKLPFVRYFALMPDAHWGQGVPIGGVVACHRVIVPYFVGSDIGCGMGAVKTTLKAEQLTWEMRRKLYETCEKVIPLSFTHNDQRRKAELRNRFLDKYEFKMQTSGAAMVDSRPVRDIESAYFEQLGTLGGGNHFAEVQADEDDNVWLMIHSGSRNIGMRICDYFDKLAQELNTKWYSDVPKGINFLPLDDISGKDYVCWMNFALAFAFHNRQVIMDSMQDSLCKLFPTVKFGKQTNIHHNYAVQERHFGQDLWVHRKGATLAEKGTRGIIPGSMGTPSYITEGLGNRDSLNSSSHGAGRIAGRNDFNKRMATEEGFAAIQKSMEGVFHGGFKKAVNRKGKERGYMEVAEAPGAYKDIDEVMANQADLVRPVVKLRPLMVLKGN